MAWLSPPADPGQSAAPSRPTEEGDEVQEKPTFMAGLNIVLLPASPGRSANGTTGFLTRLLPVSEIQLSVAVPRAHPRRPDMGSTVIQVPGSPAREPASGQVCAMLLVDIAGSTRTDRDSEILLYLRRSLYQILQDAFAGSGLPWAECHHEDRGDGVLVVLPPHVPGYGLIDPLPERLRGLIRRHNRVSREAAQMQLRTAVNIGLVDRDDHGLVGDDLNLLFRMLDAPPLRRALTDSGAELALAVSGYVHDSLVIQHPSLIDPAQFRPLEARVKQTPIHAWIYVPGWQLP
jgi:hypothetical protein